MCCAEGEPLGEGFREYPQEEYLQLSGIQHFAFCPRQWALIHLEGLWAENELTVSGEHLHENVHDASLDQIRGGVLSVRAMPVHSPSLGVGGACDLVEFHPDEGGIPLRGRRGLWRPLPVEYKRGSAKENDCDRLQLCAQAMCLEEMLAFPIGEGALFYGETRRRERVLLEEGLRRQVREMLEEMHRLLRRGHTPRPKRGKRCQSCSLKDQCLPRLERAPTVAEYLRRRLKEEP